MKGGEWDTVYGVFQAQEDEYLVFFLIQYHTSFKFQMIEGFEKGYGCQFRDSFIHRFDDNYDDTPTAITFQKCDLTSGDRRTWWAYLDSKGESANEVKELDIDIANF